MDQQNIRSDEIPVPDAALNISRREENSWAGGVFETAKKEERKWNRLDEIRNKNDERWLKVYGWSLAIVTGMFVLAFIGAFVSLAFYYLTPWGWLAPEQVEKIQSVLFSGGMGAVMIGIIRTQLTKTH